VVRVQAYPFPFLSPQRTRPLPYPRGHRDSAEIVQQPSPVNGSRVGGRGQPGCGARQRGDPPRVAGEPRALQVGGVPEPGQGLFEGRIVAEGAPGRGLGVSHRCPRVIRAAGRQQFARRVREDSGNLWIERAPGPASHGPGRDIAATDGVEHHRRIADRGESRRLGDVRASPAQWNTLAVEALEAVQDSPPDRLRQPQPSRQIRADLAVRSRPLSLQPSDTCRATQRPQPRGVNTQAQLRRQQARAHRLTRRMPASQVTHHRQRRDHTRHADPLPHNRKSKDQPSHQTTRPRDPDSGVGGVVADRAMVRLGRRRGSRCRAGVRRRTA
jgi:hypothetical protein